MHTTVVHIPREGYEITLALETPEMDLETPRRIGGGDPAVASINRQRAASREHIVIATSAIEQAAMDLAPTIVANTTEDALR